MTPQLWFLHADAIESAKRDCFLRSRRFGVSNVFEIDVAEFQHQESNGAFVGEDVSVPDDFPTPRLALPKRGFAPDYFTFSGLRFCSRRFREILAQPGGVVQWTDVDVVYGGPAVLRQDYKLLRVLAHQAVMDLGRSDCRIKHVARPKTGECRVFAGSVQRFAFIPDLTPHAEIFRIDESTSDVLVTDALAERVLQAGCTGMRFTDPECPQLGQRIERYRMATGVAEQRLHF